MTKLRMTDRCTACPYRRPRCTVPYRSNPEYRSQLEGMLSQQAAASGSPAMAEMMAGMDMSPDKVPLLVYRSWCTAAASLCACTAAAAAVQVLCWCDGPGCVERQRGGVARASDMPHGEWLMPEELLFTARSPALLQMQAQFDALGMTPDQFISKVRWRWWGSDCGWWWR